MTKHGLTAIAHKRHKDSFNNNYSISHHNLQLELWYPVSRESQAQVQQFTRAQVQLEPGRVAMGVEAVTKVSPARIQGGYTLNLGPEIWEMFLITKTGTRTGCKKTS